MKLKERLPVLLVSALVLGGLALLGARLFGGGHAAASASIHVPTFTATAQAGKVAFDRNCAQCHGTDAAGGTGKGPPLVHPIYNPGHHGDEAFYRAAAFGVRHHHWPFGDMPAQPQVGEAQMGQIIAYVRELQVANGIVWQEHRM